MANPAVDPNPTKMVMSRLLLCVEYQSHFPVYRRTVYSSSSDGPSGCVLTLLPKS